MYIPAKRRSRLLPTRLVSFLGVSILLACDSAYANPNILSGMEGLIALSLLAVAGLVVLAILLALALWYGFKWARGNDSHYRSIGRSILTGLFLVFVALVIRFVDFNNYILEDNKFDDTAILLLNYDSYYFELEDGRVFFKTDTPYAFPAAGESVVISYDNARNSTQLNKIVEVTLNDIHYRRRYVDYKFFKIPIIPARVNRYRLKNISLVTEVKPDWKFSDLLAKKEIRIIWCCNLDFTKLLIQRGGDPNRILLDKFPISHVTSELYFAYDDKARKNVESILDEMLAAGLDVNQVKSNGNTALHDAVRAIQKAQISWLLENGADLSIRNKENKTVIDLLRDRLGSPNPVHIKKEIQEMLLMLQKEY